MTAIITGNTDVLTTIYEAINGCKGKSFREIILSPNAKNNKTIFTWAIENNYSAFIKVSPHNQYQY